MGGVTQNERGSGYYDLENSGDPVLIVHPDFDLTGKQLLRRNRMYLFDCDLNVSPESEKRHNLLAQMGWKETYHHTIFQVKLYVIRFEGFLIRGYKKLIPGLTERSQYILSV